MVESLYRSSCYFVGYEENNLLYFMGNVNQLIILQVSVLKNQRNEKLQKKRPFRIHEIGNILIEAYVLMVPK